MIKLLEKPSNIAVLASKSPYLGGRILKEATVFSGDMDLMNVWYEETESGKPVSAVLFDGRTVSVISHGKGPGKETVLFIGNLASDDECRKITCDEKSFNILKGIFFGDITERNVLRSSNHSVLSKTEYDVKSDNDTKDISKVLKSFESPDGNPSEEMFDMRILRGRIRDQVKTFTAYDGIYPIGTAMVNGITSAGGNIDSVVTVPEYRKNGIATNLIGCCCEYLKERKLYSFLVPENDDLLPFYENLGFKKYCKIYDICLKG